MKIVLINAETHASIHGLFKKGVSTEVSAEAGKALLESKNEFDTLYFLTEAEAIKKGEKVLQHENGTVVRTAKVVTGEAEVKEVAEPTIVHANGGTDPEAEAAAKAAEAEAAADAAPAAGEGEIDTATAPVKPAKAKGKAVEA